MIALAASVDRIAAALLANGLILRGGFNFAPDEAPTIALSGRSWPTASKLVATPVSCYSAHHRLRTLIFG